VADFLGTSNLMPVDVIERGPGERCAVRLGESVLEKAAPRWTPTTPSR
jgi:hypothetical protein